MSEIVTMRQLLECGVHFGHQTKRWNPKMKKYIFTSRNGIHVIDLQKTIKLIKQHYKIIREIVANNGTVLFVGTKKQAQDAIEEEARKCGMPFVNHRWLGGTLTNNVTLRSSIHKYKKLNRMQEEGIFNRLSKKESSKKQKTLVRLNHYLDGIKDMSVLPSALFVVDTKREQLAVNEANRLGIPIFGVVDTNGDPNEVQYPIPANDDAIRAIKLICEIISKAVADGREDMMSRQNGNKAAKAAEAQAQAQAAAPAETAQAVEGEAVVSSEDAKKAAPRKPKAEGEASAKPAKVEA